MEAKMTTETVRMSSKGQIVIPLSVRRELGVGEGSLFAVVGGRNSLMLRKISVPSKEELIKELSVFSRNARAKLESQGVTEKNLHNK
jgi:AbrB family looped-hinge helix DNA binding protein